MLRNPKRKSTNFRLSALNLQHLLTEAHAQTYKNWQLPHQLNINVNAVDSCGKNKSKKTNKGRKLSIFARDPDQTYLPMPQQSNKANADVLTNCYNIPIDHSINNQNVAVVQDKQQQNLASRIYGSFKFTDQVTFQKVNIRNIGFKKNKQSDSKSIVNYSCSIRQSSNTQTHHHPSPMSMQHGDHSTQASFRRKIAQKSRSCQDLTQLTNSNNAHNEDSINNLDPSCLTSNNTHIQMQQPNQQIDKKQKLHRRSHTQDAYRQLYSLQLQQQQKRAEYLLPYIQHISQIKSSRNKELLGGLSCSKIRRQSSTNCDSSFNQGITNKQNQLNISNNNHQRRKRCLMHHKTKTQQNLPNVSAKSMHNHSRQPSQVQWNISKPNILQSYKNSDEAQILSIQYKKRKARKNLLQKNSKMYEVDLEKFRRYYNKQYSANANYHMDSDVKQNFTNHKDMNVNIQQIAVHPNANINLTPLQTKINRYKLAHQQYGGGSKWRKQLKMKTDNDELKKQDQFYRWCDQFENIMKIRIRHQIQYNWEAAGFKQKQSNHSP